MSFHRVKFEQPISHDLILTIDLLDPEVRTVQLLQQLYLISKEASSGKDMEKFWRRKEATSRYVVGQLLLAEPILKALRRELRTVSSGVTVNTEHIGELLRNELIKRDALEGEKAEAASKLVRRVLRRRQKERAADAQVSDAAAAPLTEAVKPVKVETATPIA
jgi:hypothetical protein